MRGRLTAGEKRASALGVLIERVDRSKLHEMYDGKCGICDKPVGARKFDIDHIVPLSRGGVHAYANTQPAHVQCNRWKDNRLPEEILYLSPPGPKRYRQRYRNRPAHLRI